MSSNKPQLAVKYTTQRVTAGRLQLHANEFMNKPQNSTFLSYRHYAVKGSKKNEQQTFWLTTFMLNSVKKIQIQNISPSSVGQDRNMLP